ncbi:hypothetical protein NI17_000790 [Thermobifida halotolerans]|uniref:Uncharacterized protein n=1 Tax=Thermobifida halotolerans TaxID=483545 RepID=A0AA97LXE2_9ACTN|nr:hypothetical protein [Thermobifida halotolerans]UOE19835.1 hypothetical protein NI17_000790 [Thermobifida halotolerans]
MSGEAAGRDARIGAARHQSEDRLRKLAVLVAPRTECTLVHGESGPDHVPVGDDGRAVLVDVEVHQALDVDEHVFPRVRFCEHYAAPARPGLDPRRLLDGDFPDRDVMRGIAEHNLRETLTLLEPAGD